MNVPHTRVQLSARSLRGSSQRCEFNIIDEEFMYAVATLKDVALDEIPILQEFQYLR